MSDKPRLSEKLRAWALDISPTDQPQEPYATFAAEAEALEGHANGWLRACRVAEDQVDALEAALREIAEEDWKFGKIGVRKVAREALGESE